MNKLLIVYNICEIAGNGNSATYIDHLRALLSQQGFEDNDLKFAVSGCMVTDITQYRLTTLFGNHLSYNFVQQNVPLSVSFNDTIDRCTEAFGEFDGYLYVDSGISFWDPCQRYDALKILWDVYKSGNYAIAAAMPSNDDGSSWWGIQYKAGEDYVYKLPQITNMHCQIFSGEWKRAYRRILPDIFASNCMESVFPFMAAALKSNIIMTNKIMVQHIHSMDGASIGSRQPDPDKISCSSVFQTPGLMYKTKRDMDVRFRIGYDYGFGFESCSPYWPFDSTKFDEKGHALDERLLPFLQQEMYLTKEEFNYDFLNRNWITGR